MNLVVAWDICVDVFVRNGNELFTLSCGAGGDRNHT
jgi:hypothetical protein